MMLLNGVREGTEIDELTPEEKIEAKADPNSEVALDAMAEELENLCTENALSAVRYFDGGEEAVKSFTESAEVQSMLESRKFSKATYVRLNKSDDLQRRTHLAALILAKEHNDALWKKLAQNRVRERKLRAAIFAKYGNKAAIVARKSQIVHQKKMRKLPSLPKIKF